VRQEAHFISRRSYGELRNLRCQCLVSITRYTLSFPEVAAQINPPNVYLPRRRASEPILPTSALTYPIHRTNVHNLRQDLTESKAPSDSEQPQAHCTKQSPSKVPTRNTPTRQAPAQEIKATVGETVLKKASVTKTDTEPAKEADDAAFVAAQAHAAAFHDFFRRQTTIWIRTTCRPSDHETPVTEFEFVNNVHMQSRSISISTR
jgi:hypothetical protein